MEKEYVQAKYLVLSLIVLFISSMLNGCVGSGGLDTAHKTLSLSQKTAVSVARTAKDLHLQGLITDVTLAKIRDSYQRMQRAQRTAIDLAKIAVGENQSPNDNEKYRTSLRIMNAALLELTNLAIEVGILDTKGEL